MKVEGHPTIIGHLVPESGRLNKFNQGHPLRRFSRSIHKSRRAINHKKCDGSHNIQEDPYRNMTTLQGSFHRIPRIEIRIEDNGFQDKQEGINYRENKEEMLN